MVLEWSFKQLFTMFYILRVFTVCKNQLNDVVMLCYGLLLMYSKNQVCLEALCVNYDDPPLLELIEFTVFFVFSV